MARIPPDAIIRGGVRLPCSSPRKTPHTFAKLLCSVDPEALTGFGFEGRLFRPGALVAPSELRPSIAYPEIPILLEYAGGVGPGTGHNRRAQLYVLWRYYAGEWLELGRAASESWDWACDLRPLAVRALAEARAPVLSVVIDLRVVVARIVAMLDLELRGLESGDRVRLLGVLHDQFAGRLCG
jgi:hypothetical protein